MLNPLSATRSQQLKLSVIIPVLNEEHQIAKTIAELSAGLVDLDVEIVIVDGGSDDRTVEFLRQIDFLRVIEFGSANRGLQMNDGARVSRGNVLLFLHADVRLPRGAVRSIERALARENVVGGCFQIRFPQGAPFSLRVNEHGINLRTRLFRTATGDQAIFVCRDVFESVGGYQGIPLMEDIEFFNQVKKLGRVIILDDRVEISPRRWLKHGVWRTMFLMYALRFGYWIGISPVTLKRFFVDVR